MTFEEKETQYRKAYVLIYQLMEAGRKQNCAKNLIVSQRDPEVIQYAREKLKNAQRDAGIAKDKLWELFNGENEVLPKDADHYEFLIQRAWAAHRMIRKAEKEIVETENPLLEAFLRKELDAKKEEALFLESNLFLFLQDLASRSETENN